MATANKKTAEQMNAERRANKAKRKHNRNKSVQDPGFDMGSYVKDRREHDRFYDGIERMAARADKGLVKISAYSVSNDVYKALYRFVKDSPEYSYVLNREAGWLMYWKVQSQQSAAA